MVTGRTVPIVGASSLDDVERLLGTARRRVVLIFDADNTLVPRSAPRRAFRRDVLAAVDRFEARDQVRRVLVLTNGPDRGVPDVVHHGNKPWTTRRRLGLDARDEVWIVGDQVLTDGLLAWRLGGLFVHLALDVEHERARQALMRRLGSVLQGFLFHPYEPQPAGWE